MIKTPDNTYRYSPSDLTLFMRSPFAAWMARKTLDDPAWAQRITTSADPMQALLAQKGNQHEIDFLAALKEKYGPDQISVIPTGNETIAYDETLKAMKAGVQVIYQAYLKRDDFAGYADFLIKREGTSELGDYYYEAWDTKFSKTTQAYFVMQLCCYSWMLADMQGRLPDEIVIVLGNNNEQRLRIAAYDSYFQSLKRRFLDAQAQFDPNAMPDPALSKDYGPWGDFAKQHLIDTDSLALVANIRKSQIKALHQAGITRLKALANTPASTNIPGLSQQTFEKLQAQAQLQQASKGRSTPSYTVQPHPSHKGLEALPPSSNNDVFFDIEGHPLIDGGLEYLWGVSYVDAHAPQGQHYAFKDWWAHDAEQEKRALEGFIDWVYARWQEDNSMHIYHYASYEITALLKLTSRYQTRLDQVATLLKNGVFVDLYKVVRNGLLIGEPSYSIKNVEHLYRTKRTTTVANGGDSVVVYESWRDTGGVDEWANKGYPLWQHAPEHFNWSLWPILQSIRDYNIDDCESTLELVEWLRQQQQDAGITYQPVASTIEEKEKTAAQLNAEAKRQELWQQQQTLIDQFANDPTLQKDPYAKLLIDLLRFHDRERRPKIWAYYERLAKADDELFDDNTVVFGIRVTQANVAGEKLVCEGEYDFTQPVREDKFNTATLWGQDGIKVGDIEFVTPTAGATLAALKFTIDDTDFDAGQASPLTLLGNEDFINTSGLEERLCSIVEDYFNNRSLDGALKTLFDQAPPVFTTQASALPINRQNHADNDDYLNAIIEAVKTMNTSCLCIQGPPGAGKTHTAKHVIMALVLQGQRIGIMSNSHAAIMNLLLPLSESLPATTMAKIGGHGNKQADFQAAFPTAPQNLVYRPQMTFMNNQSYSSFNVLGGTAFAFAKDIAYNDPLDYLFVDEASQVALANMVAASGAAKNIVLMGDQMQLEQPIQGSHPGQAGSSALEFMLKGHAVIPDTTGIFLERTFRMHPDICQPLSEVVYEGRLQADADNSHQAIHIPKPQAITQTHGIMRVTVPHEGNTQKSEQEVSKIQDLLAELQTGQYTDKQGQAHRITDQDILIVAPYNMQVNLLKNTLGSQYRIGTIDKFQGQEAPVVIISMTVSDVEDSPRGLDFVFDINRLNVAISRAKALAIVVANEGLERCVVNGLGQMEKVGFFIKTFS